jgi:ring-1,2-phenylacetyl-CoA epoxidase subunit PaaC
MRQFLNDALMQPLFSDLKLSKDERFAGIAEKAVKESTYHLRHSSQWIIRLAQGTEESKEKIVEALNELWTYTGEMFEWSDEEKDMATKGLIPSFDELRKKWNTIVKSTFDEAGLEAPKDKWMDTGGRQGIHSEYLGHMLGDMQYLPRAYPNDKW